MDATLGLLGSPGGGGGGGGGGGVPSGGSATGSISIVSKEDNLALSSEISSSYPNESGLELGLGLSIGGGLKSKGGSWGQYARILTAKDFPSSGTKRNASDPVSLPNGTRDLNGKETEGLDGKRNDHFFDRAEKVSFFFEEKAFDDHGNLKQPKQLSINKVGHALHDMEPVFKRVSCSEKMSSILRPLGYKRPVIIQSMYIFKQPGIGGEVVPHQDNSFLFTEPATCTGLWLALEDATILNGCLWAIPGSHKDGLVRRFIRDEMGFILIVLSHPMTKRTLGLLK